MAATFAKVSKMGEVLIVRIPNKDAKSFKSGDFVLIKTVDELEVENV